MKRFLFLFLCLFFVGCASQGNVNWDYSVKKQQFLDTLSLNYEIPSDAMLRVNEVFLRYPCLYDVQLKAWQRPDFCDLVVFWYNNDAPSYYVEDMIKKMPIYLGGDL